MKFNRGVDNSVPTSPTWHTSNRNDDGTTYAYSVPASRNSSMNSFLAQGVPQQESRKNPFSWHRYPFLSRFRSQSGDKDTSQYVSSMDSECEETPVSSESFIANNMFHFSFYKWAGKRALLMLAATVQEKDGNIIGVRSFPQVVVQGIDLIDEEESMPTATVASNSQTDYEDYKSGKDGLFERKHSTNSTTKEEALSLVFDEYMRGDKTKETGTKYSTNNAKNNVSAASPSAHSSRPTSGEKIRGSRVLKDFIKIFSPKVSPKQKGSPEAQDQISSGKNGSKGGVEDKFSISSLEVDEDVKTDKMNNQNAFSAGPSPMSEVQGRMEKPIPAVDNEMQTRTGKFSGREDVKPPSSDGLPYSECSSGIIVGVYSYVVISFSRSWFVRACFVMIGVIFLLLNFCCLCNLQELPMQYFFLFCLLKLIHVETEEKVRDTISHEESHVEDLEGCVVEHFFEDHVLRDDKEKEQIKISESKIREWSTGKKEIFGHCFLHWNMQVQENIFHVLWPESGWKPVPLVDIIEGAAVKKAYQKALLCLHPDKLQQRGAAMHQKYIAEKVFDILQEAWKESNSVTFG